MFVKLLKMKTTTKLLSILLLIMLLQSCDKDTVPFNNVPLNTYYYLTAWQLNQTPYFTNKAFDTISFASDKGDTLTVVKTKTDTTWYCERSSTNPSSNIQNCYQTIHNTYSTIKGVGSFDVKHSRKISYKDLTNIIQIKFNNCFFYEGDNAINDITHPRFLGKININNKTFFKTMYSYDNYSDSLTSIFNINIDYGVFFIDDKINNLKYLITK